MTMGLQDNGCVRTWPSQTNRAAGHRGAARLDRRTAAVTVTGTRSTRSTTAYYYACSQSSGGGTHSCRRYGDAPTADAAARRPAAPAIPQNGFPSNQRYTTHAPLVIDPQRSTPA